jgi:glutamyl-tRNA reductase
MWASLVILHSHKLGRSQETVEGLVDWHTCMRSVYIGDQRLLCTASYYTLYDYEVYTGYKAYSFLLEIVSGVHSKLYGETEVQSQFNERFSKQNLLESPLSSYLIRLKNQILENVKQIRSEYMKGKGRLTYGGAADSLLPKGSPVAVYGTGKLAESILVHLIKKNRKIILVGRNLERMDFLKSIYNVEIAHHGVFQPYDHSIVIASPHFPLEVTKEMSSNSIILDFRSEVTLQFPYEFTHHKYYSFQSILNKIQETKDNEIHLKPIVLKRIQELTQDRENDVVQIPNGWEDIHWLI